MESGVPKDQETHIILDNYATHKHPKVLVFCINNACQ